jgi:hypothetical protein
MTGSDPSPHLQPEPQEARGAPGSRDTGAPPGEEPAGRPAGQTEGSTNVDSKGTKQDDMEAMPAGDQGG